MFNVNVESVKAVLGNKALHRGVEHHDVAHALREKSEAYNGDFGSKSEALSLETTIFWNETAKTAGT